MPEYVFIQMRDRWGQTKEQAGGERENETFWKKNIMTDIMKMQGRHA